MPGGDGPPLFLLPEAEFNAVHAMTYSAANQSFTSGGSNYFLFVEQVSGSTDRGQWFHATSSASGHPKGLIPQITGDVITRGTYNASNGTVSFNSKSYRIRLVVASGASPTLLAEAHEV